MATKIYIFCVKTHVCTDLVMFPYPVNKLTICATWTLTVHLKHSKNVYIYKIVNTKTKLCCIFMSIMYVVYYRILPILLIAAMFWCQDLSSLILCPYCVTLLHLYRNIKSLWLILSFSNWWTVMSYILLNFTVTLNKSYQIKQVPLAFRKERSL